MKVLPLRCERLDLRMARVEVPTPVGDVKNSVPKYDFRAKYVDTQKKGILLFILICFLLFAF